jgi:hypothetical protein
VPGIDNGGRVELEVSTEDGHIRISICRSSLAVLLCRLVSNLYYCELIGRQYRKCWCLEGRETRGWSKMRSLRLAIDERLLSNVCESGTSRILDRLPRALALLPLPLVPIYASSSLCSMHARTLHLRRRLLAGVHRRPRYSFLVLFPQTRQYRTR